MFRYLEDWYKKKAYHITAIVASVLLAAFLGALGILNGMHSAYVAIYQIICVLPAIISSKLMLN